MNEKEIITILREAEKDDITIVEIHRKQHIFEKLTIFR
jgi:hypothetical protein